MTTLEKLEKIYMPNSKILHIQLNQLRSTDLPDIFAFIEKNQVQTFSVEGIQINPLNMNNYYFLYTDLIKHIYKNKTLQEINLFVFNCFIKTHDMLYTVKELLSRHPTLQRVYLTPYHIRFGSHIINK
jgi:hypothetical protein